MFYWKRQICQLKKETEIDGVNSIRNKINSWLRKIFEIKNRM
jgi:hypothetical protein